LADVAPKPRVLPDPRGKELKTLVIDLAESADPVQSDPSRLAQTGTGQHAQGKACALEAAWLLRLTHAFRGHG
jgi:hypothetical protein